MKKSTLVLAAALAFLAAPALRAMDDWERHVKVAPDTLIRGVTIPAAFRGLDGKAQPAGVYDLKLHQGTQGILIGLLRNGKSVGEFPGKFAAGVDPTNPNLKNDPGDGSIKQGGATQGHDISIRKTGGLHDIHFDVSSRVGFEYGGLRGRISPSNNLHPGGANLGSISFLLPAVNVQRK